MGDNVLILSITVLTLLLLQNTRAYHKRLGYHGKII